MLPYMHAYATGMPLWPDVATAIGTVILATATFVTLVVTVLITRQDRSNGVAAAKAEHEVADTRLDRQIASSASQLQAERAAADERLQRQLDASNAQFQAEREARREQEQMSEAYLVQVTPGRMAPELFGSRITTEPDTPITCPCVIIVNRGHYTIARIRAQFSTDGRNLLQYGKREHFSPLRGLADELSSNIDDEPDVRLSTLTPTDCGMRFSHDAIAVKNLFGSYPIVRWEDRWGQMWEHKLGIVRKTSENEQWMP
jgi:hypothetical protein